MVVMFLFPPKIIICRTNILPDVIGVTNRSESSRDCVQNQFQINVNKCKCGITRSERTHRFKKAF